jgi:flagellar biosynthesis/type III secretory pathway protein FliH
VSIGRAAIEAAVSLPDEQRLLYSKLIEKALSEAARKALQMEPHIDRFFTETHRQSYAEGEAKGKAEGEARALMRILHRRGLAMTDEQQRQILSCMDLAILDRWLDRALSVASVDELLA